MTQWSTVYSCTFLKEINIHSFLHIPKDCQHDLLYWILGLESFSWTESQYVSIPCVVCSYADSCRTQRHNEDKRHSLLEKYTSHFIWKVACERELETEQNGNILTPTLMAISVVSLSFSRVAQPEARGPSFLLSASFVYHIWSPKLTDFLSSLSYIIIQSPTQYLWNGMFDHHQAEITVMQFTGHSLQSINVPWDFTLSYIVS